MTNHSTTRNQEPEPVRPWFARLLRRPGRDFVAALAAEPPTARPLPRNGDALAALLRQAEDLKAAREEAARWKGYADSYDRERNEARRECAQLLAWLAALHPASAVITPAHDGEGTQDLYIVAGGWQLSWHIHPDDVGLFKHVTVVDVTDPRVQWDGHGSEQRGERIHNHTRLLALDELGTDGALTGVTEVRSA